MSGRRRGGAISDALDLFPVEAPARAPRASARASASRARTLDRMLDRDPARLDGRPSDDLRDRAGDVTRDVTLAAAYAPPAALALDSLGEPLGEPSWLEIAEEAIPGTTPASAISVALLNQTVKELVDGAFVPLWVRGEVSDFKAHRNGHWYFTLRDATAQIRCVIWARDARRLPAAPDDGMQVVAFGQLSVYAARADLQLAVRTLDAAGDGLWRKALERTRAALDADGLLDPARKRALPRFPRCIAVVTSPDGAALHDIAAVVRRRWPAATLAVVAAKVQGDGAVEELCAAVARVARAGLADVMIIGRGGGAREDLWAFNDERLARAVAACPIPTISAVGHEVDITICDLVADLRAPTPSAAAEAAVPVLAEVRDDVETLGHVLVAAVRARIEDARGDLDAARSALVDAVGRAVERQRATLATSAAQLHALSPLATLARGYAAARDAGTGAPLSAVADFPPGRAFTLQLRDGTVRARAESSSEPSTPSPGIS